MALRTAVGDPVAGVGAEAEEGPLEQEEAGEGLPGGGGEGEPSPFAFEEAVRDELVRKEAAGAGQVPEEGDGEGQATLGLLAAINVTNVPFDLSSYAARIW